MGWRSLKRLVIERDKKCKKCGSAHDLTIDHIVPLSRGGTNTPENLQALCRKCNANKSNFIHWDLLQRIKIALHVDELFTRLQNECMGGISGLRTSMNSEIERRVQSKIDKLKGTLYKPQDCDRCTHLSERLRALEEHLGIEFVEETIEVRGYRKVKKTKKS